MSEITKIVSDFELIKHPSAEILGMPAGMSAANLSLVFHTPKGIPDKFSVLDIGFGAGNLGRVISSYEPAKNWIVDGVDGFEANCFNKDLINKKYYRNIWHGYAQNLDPDIISGYDVICLLDVIEHLDSITAKWLLHKLLNIMRNDAYLFISTPLWFYPNNQLQAGDLEEHLIGVPATSMFALCPLIYSMGSELVCGFILDKRSLDYIELFNPITSKSFTKQRGENLLRVMGLNYEPGKYYKTALFDEPYLPTL